MSDQDNGLQKVNDREYTYRGFRIEQVSRFAWQIGKDNVRFSTKHRYLSDAVTEVDLFYTGMKPR